MSWGKSRAAGRVWRRVAALALAGTVTGALAQEPPAVDPATVADALRTGGYVIYFRHTATEQSGAPDEAADLARCETQRNLSAAGRAQAAEIGKAFKALRIPVGRVQTSPFCRTRETAELAFGHYEVNKDLHFVITSGAEEAQRLGKALRRLLATAPRKGTNSVIVSHSANLREAAGVFAKPEGAAYIYRPLPNGGFEPVARLLPEDWVNLAQRKRPTRSP
jgi:broad specificity phosphatase PhoE